MVPATVQAATRGLTSQQRDKVNDAASQLVDQKKSAIDKLKAYKESLPLRTAGSMGGALLVGAEAGATDALAEVLNIPRPLGIRPSHIKGTAALLTAAVAAFMGWPTIVEIAAPIAGGNLIPHAYGLGYGAVKMAKSTIDKVKPPATPAP